MLTCLCVGDVEVDGAVEYDVGDYCVVVVDCFSIMLMLRLMVQQRECTETRQNVASYSCLFVCMTRKYAVSYSCLCVSETNSGILFAFVYL